jgi:hypothetical protein
VLVSTSIVIVGALTLVIRSVITSMRLSARQAVFRRTIG